VDKARVFHFYKQENGVISDQSGYDENRVVSMVLKSDHDSAVKELQNEYNESYAGLMRQIKLRDKKLADYEKALQFYGEMDSWVHANGVVGIVTNDNESLMCNDYAFRSFGGKSARSVLEKWKAKI